MTPCILGNKYYVSDCSTDISAQSAVCPQRYVCTTSLIPLHGLVYRVQSQAKNWTL